MVICVTKQNGCFSKRESLEFLIMGVSKIRYEEECALYNRFQGERALISRNFVNRVLLML